MYKVELFFYLYINYIISLVTYLPPPSPLVLFRSIRLLLLNIQGYNIYTICTNYKHESFCKIKPLLTCSVNTKEQSMVEDDSCYVHYKVNIAIKKRISNFSLPINSL